MPSTGSNRTTQENLLRTVYTSDMRRQFNLKSILLQSIQRNSKSFSQGLQISVPLHAGTGSGPVWDDGGSFPPPSHEQIGRAYFNYRYLLDQIELAADFIDDAGSASAAEIGPLELETKSLVKRMRHDLNVDLYGDGSGTLATITSSASGTTFIVPSLRGLRNNLRVDVLLTATGAVGAGGVYGAQISINRANNTVTLINGATLADGTGAFLNANAASYTVYRHKSRNQAIFGLSAIVSNTNPAGGNYGQVDRSLDTNDFYRATVLSNGGVARAISLPLIQQCVDAVNDASEGSTDLIIVGNSVWSQITEQLSSDKRYGGEKMLLNGWAEAIKFGTIPIVKDRHCQPDRMYCLDTTMFRIYQNNEGTWMDKDGAILSRVPGKAAYSAGWTRRAQCVCLAPIAQGLISDLEFVA